MQKTINYGQYALILGVAILLLGSFVGWFAPSVNTETVSVTQTTCDVDALTDKVDNIQETIDEDDLWESEAINLATEEFSRSDYKYVFRALEDIDEKEDIEKVLIKDSEVTSFDVDDKDATVVQKIKVYYENLDGDDVKEYLIVTTYIEDGEVEDQEFEFE